jgi:hypothetical protein
MFEFQSVRRSFPRKLAENSEAASFFCQTTSFETEVQEREETVWYDSAICRQGKKGKKHWGFPTKVSDMARDMKMELHTFYTLIYIFFY